MARIQGREISEVARIEERRIADFIFHKESGQDKMLAIQSYVPLWHFRRPTPFDTLIM
jgi:hypothetical protein